MTTYEVRSDPDGLPTVFNDLARAERNARRRSHNGPLWVYEVDERGERCLGVYDGGCAYPA